MRMFISIPVALFGILCLLFFCQLTNEIILYKSLQHSHSYHIHGILKRKEEAPLPFSTLLVSLLVRHSEREEEKREREEITTKTRRFCLDFCEFWFGVPQLRLVYVVYIAKRNRSSGTILQVNGLQHILCLLYIY